MNGPKPYVITIVGPESSGKTRLASQLSAHFKSSWIPEYAREYLVSIGRPYNASDLEVIAKEEIKRIQSLVSGELSLVSGEWSVVNGELSVVSGELLSLIEAAKQKEMVIIDGGLLNLRMWARIKYQIEIPVIEAALQYDVTDLYLLCRPRKDWEHDPFREAPSLVERSWIFNQYLAELSRSNIKTEIVRTD